MLVISHTAIKHVGVDYSTSVFIISHVLFKMIYDFKNCLILANILHIKIPVCFNMMLT